MDHVAQHQRVDFARGRQLKVGQQLGFGPRVGHIYESLMGITTGASVAGEMLDAGEEARIMVTRNARSREGRHDGGG